MPASLAGALYGLTVWGARLAGFVPALGMMQTTTGPSLKKSPPHLAGHIVYGVTTALAYEALEDVLD